MLSVNFDCVAVDDGRLAGDIFGRRTCRNGQNQDACKGVFFMVPFICLAPSFSQQTAGGFLLERVALAGCSAYTMPIEGRTMTDETAQASRLMKVIDEMIKELRRGRGRGPRRSQLQPANTGRGGEQSGGRRRGRIPGRAAGSMR
jgi:hypothetical protein